MNITISKGDRGKAGKSLFISASIDYRGNRKNFDVDKFASHDAKRRDAGGFQNFNGMGKKSYRSAHLLIDNRGILRKL